jgi:hypothetical protein
MQPMGRKPIRFPGKQDHHPRKPLANWWEVEVATEDKSKDRQQARRDIIEELRTLGQQPA